MIPLLARLGFTVRLFFFFFFIIRILLVVSVGAIRLLVNIQLRGILDDVVTGPRDLNSWVVGLCILRDLVSTMTDNLCFALFDDFGNFAARSRTTILPRDYVGVSGIKED